MRERTWTVYKHTSPIGKVYIGITCQKPEKRWKSGEGYKSCPSFYNAIKKYGWDNIQHEILASGLSKDDAKQLEIDLISNYVSTDKKYGYNILPGGDLPGGRRLDLQGQRFGRLIVKERTSPNKDGRSSWICACDCGNETIATTHALRSGEKKSCGCLKHEPHPAINPYHKPVTDLSGKRFGRLTVVCRGDDHVDPSGRHKTRWQCICDCGNKVVVYSSNLKSGKTQSCGCYMREINTVNGKANKKHGDCQSRLYHIWNNMKQRCYNQNQSAFKYYGALGVFVCDEWLSDFSIFKNWAINNGYEDTLSLHIIDKNCGYCPTNCEFVDQHKCNSNRNPLAS